MFLSTVRRWYRSRKVREQVREQARENRVGHGLGGEEGTRKVKWSWNRVRKRERGREGRTREQTPQSPLPTSSPVISSSPSIPEPPISISPEPTPPTTKRVQRLEHELNSGRLPVVRYLPAPEIVSGFNQAATAEWLARWVHSDLPSVCIEHQNACCYICLMDFEKPQLKSTLGDEGSSALPLAEPLRQLVCRHVFHQLCIDSYLFGDDSERFRCPVCHERIIPLRSDLEQWKFEFRELVSTHQENLGQDHSTIEQNNEQDGDEDEEAEVEDEDDEEQEVGGQEIEGQHVEGQEVGGQEVEGQEVEDRHIEGQEVEGQRVEEQQVEDQEAEDQEAEGRQVQEQQVEGEGDQGDEQEDLGGRQEQDLGHEGQEGVQGGGDQGQAADGSPQFDEDGLLVGCEYTFALNNKYLNLSSPNHSLLRNAKTLLEQNGNLSEAALILEAAIQIDDLGDGGYEAWILLGETRRLDARSEMGMHALVQGVRHAQAAGAMGPGMLSLAIAYTNLSHHNAFHVMLLRWLQTRFPDSPIPKMTLNSIAGADSSSNAHDDVVNAFLSLVGVQHSEGIEDPDMQIALGELYRTEVKYERARSCFGSALAADLQNYLFWNKLGCSFPDGDDAVAAFQEAARLRPTYTLAFANLALTHYNLRASREAAEYFLTAISLQQAAGEKSTEAIWNDLRDTFRQMGRPELADISTDEDQTNFEVYRKEGFHF